MAGSCQPPRYRTTWATRTHVVNASDPFAVKHHSWRPAGAPEDDKVYEGEVVALTMAINDQGYAVGKNGYKGGEDELNAADVGSGEPTDLYASYALAELTNE